MLNLRSIPTFVVLIAILIASGCASNPRRHEVETDSPLYVGIHIKGFSNKKYKDKRYCAESCLMAASAALDAHEYQKFFSLVTHHNEAWGHSWRLNRNGVTYYVYGTHLTEDALALNVLLKRYADEYERNSDWSQKIDSSIATLNKQVQEYNSRPSSTTRALLGLAGVAASVGPQAVQQRKANKEMAASQKALAKGDLQSAMKHTDASFAASNTALQMEIAKTKQQIADGEARRKQVIHDRRIRETENAREFGRTIQPLIENHNRGEEAPYVGQCIVESARSNKEDIESVGSKSASKTRTDGWSNECPFSVIMFSCKKGTCDHQYIVRGDNRFAIDLDNQTFCPTGATSRDGVCYWKWDARPRAKE